MCDAITSFFGYCNCHVPKNCLPTLIVALKTLLVLLLLLLSFESLLPLNPNNWLPITVTIVIFILSTTVSVIVLIISMITFYQSYQKTVPILCTITIAIIQWIGLREHLNRKPLDTHSSPVCLLTRGSKSYLIITFMIN